MYSNDFEAAFSCFLERRDYDEAANPDVHPGPSGLCRWMAGGGGDPASGGAIFTLLRGGAEDGQREAASQPEIG